MRIRKNTNGSVPRLANGGAQKWADGVECCCDGCTTCCFKVTFSGVTLPSGSIDAGISDTVPIEVTNWGESISGPFYACAESGGVYTAHIPVLQRITGVLETEGGDPVTTCGYLVMQIGYDTGTNTISVRLGTGAAGPGLPNWTFGEDGGDVFEAIGSGGSLPDEFVTALAGGDCSEADGISTTVTNTLSYSQFSTPLAVTGGTATVEIVPNCDGANDAFEADSDCECAEFEDVYLMSIQCDIGTTPDAWVDIEITRTTGNPCRWTGVEGQWTGEMNYDAVANEWSASIYRTSPVAMLVDAVPWSGSPIGTHTFNSTSTGYPDAGDTYLDDQCSALAIVIS